MACRAISSEAFGEEEKRFAHSFGNKEPEPPLPLSLLIQLTSLALPVPFSYEILLPNTFTVPHITPLKSGLCMKAVDIVIQAMFVCRLY